MLCHFLRKGRPQRGEGLRRGSRICLACAHGHSKLEMHNSGIGDDRWAVSVQGWAQEVVRPGVLMPSDDTRHCTLWGEVSSPREGMVEPETSIWRL